MIQVSDIPFKILMMSRGRAAMVARHPLLSVSHVCVDTEEDREEYLEMIGRLGTRSHVVHVLSKHAPTIGGARRAAMDDLWDESEPFVMMIDDDTLGLESLMGWKKRVYQSPEDLCTIFWESYRTASELPTGLFGYSRGGGAIRFRQTNQPIGVHVSKQGQPKGLGNVVAMIFGVLDRELRFDPNLSFYEDVDLNWQCRAKYRFFLRDSRLTNYFSEGGVGGAGIGGLVSVRANPEYQIRSERYLRAKWVSTFGREFFNE